MKVFNDILKSPEGKYSRKSIYALASFIVATTIAIIGLFRVVETTLVVELVTIFICTFLTLIGFTVWNKTIPSKKDV